LGRPLQSLWAARRAVGCGALAGRDDAGGARIIEPHIDRVVLANPKAVKNATQSAKTDRLGACTLARLLAAGFSARGVDAGRADARVLGRRISRRRVSLRSFAAAS
jgi:hypothetical protein